MVKCSRNFGVMMMCVAYGGLVLMFAQWWALWTVRRWGREMNVLRVREYLSREDEEKAVVGRGLETIYEEDEKRGF